MSRAKLAAVAATVLACSHPGASAQANAPPAPDAARTAAAPAAAPEPLSPPQRAPDVPYVPTPQAVVDEMLRLAAPKPGDVLYDLGCGDGRIVITAAKQFGVRGVGIDINPVRVGEARQNAKAAGVESQVQFRQQDLFETDLREATVVTLYLLPDVNLKLRPRLLEQLRPGTRVVSHAFDMGDWKPEQTVNVDGSTVYLWTVPPRAAAAAVK
jgi:SAM-dependent methyltransferase